MRSSDTDDKLNGTTFIDTTITRFTRAEWDLLVRLPGMVVVAATSEAADDSRQMIEALAGLDAVAAGRGWANSLVRQVVGTIYAEPEMDSAATRADHSPIDPLTGVATVLATCRQAAVILALRATAAERIAYERWLASIAFRVSDASAGVAGLGTNTTHAVTERRFVAELAAAFR